MWKWPRNFVDTFNSSTHTQQWQPAPVCHSSLIWPLLDRAITLSLSLSHSMVPWFIPTSRITRTEDVIIDSQIENIVNCLNVVSANVVDARAAAEYNWAMSWAPPPVWCLNSLTNHWTKKWCLEIFQCGFFDNDFYPGCVSRMGVTVVTVLSLYCHCIVTVLSL